MNLNSERSSDENELYNDYKTKKKAYDKLDNALAMRVAMNALVDSSVDIESGRREIEAAKQEMELAKERFEQSQLLK